jgi:hypothetical protein
MLLLREIRFVDLEKSGYNAKLSDPTSGKMVYDLPKHYLHLGSGAVDKQTIAKEFGIVIKWGTTNERDLSRLVWQGYETLTIADGIYPEPLKLDGEGRFLNYDAFPMKIPTQEYVKIRQRDIAKSENASKARRTEFQNTVANEEAGAVLTDEEINQVLGT